MKIDIFELERIQSLYENTVDYNLTETGLHPFTLKELLTPEEIDRLSSISLGYGQTDGSPQLREAIARLYPGAHPSNVLVTNGSAEANFLVIWSMLHPGDELVLMLPNYMQIWGLARSFGVHVKPFYLREELNWRPSLDELNALLTSKTKMIALCNPNNPTGAVLSEEIMQGVFKAAEKIGAWIFVDEIYRGAELSGEDTPTFYNYSGYEKVVVNGGLSKAYGLPGLRTGWLVGPARIIAEAWAYHDYTTISTGILSQHLAARVLEPVMRSNVLNRNRKMLKENIICLQDWINKHDNLFSFIPPQAGAMAFIHYNMEINSREFTERLRKQKSVFIMDGDCFGMDKYLRIGFGSPKNYLIEGLRRIDQFLTEIT